jgi:hypothetical protein
MVAPCSRRRDLKLGAPSAEEVLLMIEAVIFFAKAQVDHVGRHTRNAASRFMTASSGCSNLTARFSLVL